MKHHFIGVDPNGVPRVYCTHANIDVAETWCVEEMWRYRRQRPDLGPASKWAIVHTVAPVTRDLNHGECT